jgi:hypothetical protein
MIGISLIFRIAAFLGVCLISIGTCMLSPGAPVGDDAGVVMELPDEINGYVGKSTPPSEAERKSLPPDTSFETKVYDLRNGNQMTFNIVLSGEDRSSIHRPEICLPGQGWTITSSQVRPISLSEGRVLEVMDLGLEQEHEMDNGEKRTIRAHYYYWFVGKDVTTPKHLTRVLITSFDNIFENLNHRWAYISGMMYVSGSVLEQGMTDEETQKFMDGMVANSVDSYQKTFGSSRWWISYIPGM